MTPEDETVISGLRLAWQPRMDDLLLALTTLKRSERQAILEDLVEEVALDPELRALLPLADVDESVRLRLLRAIRDPLPRHLDPQEDFLSHVAGEPRVDGEPDAKEGVS